MMVSRTVKSGYKVAAWKPLPSPSLWRAGADMWLTSRPSTSIDPLDGTKPEMAFIRVDLPAPLVPISPTSSP